MTIYRITYENGETEIVDAVCEEEVWVGFGDGFDGFEIVRVEAVGFRVVE